MPNYFTTEIVVGDDAYKTKKASNLEDVCKHVQEDPSKLHIISREKDSFGIVGEIGLCNECHTKARKEADEELVYCNDCNQQVPRKETISWTWYDFYAAQGDEPIIVCRTCENGDKHRQRVARDNAECDAEFGDDYDYEDDF